MFETFASGDAKRLVTREDFEAELGGIATATARANQAAAIVESLVVNKAGINDTTATLTEAYSGVKTEQLFANAKNYADGLFANVTSFTVSVVAQLPTSNIDTHTIYFVPCTASQNNNYDEYMYINNTWEHIGSTTVDLTNYLTKTGSTSNNTVTFTEATAEADIVSGESHGTIFGKLLKSIKTFRTKLNRLITVSELSLGNIPSNTPTEVSTAGSIPLRSVIIGCQGTVGNNDIKDMLVKCGLNGDITSIRVTLTTAQKIFVRYITFNT